MLSDVVGKAVVVLLLVFGEVERGGVLAAEKEINEGGIVETAVELGAHTVTVGYAAFGGAVGFDSQGGVCGFIYWG